MSPAPMIAVIFEVKINPESKQDYLDAAAELKPLLSKIEGFVSIERFQSLADPEKILSLSFWENEEAVAQWRNQEQHRDAQHLGRTKVFEHYQLRVAHVIRNYSATDRGETPADSESYHG